MITKGTISAVKYGVFRVSEDGLIKIPDKYKNESFTTVERAADFVYDSNDSECNYLILPIAIWEYE